MEAFTKVVTQLADGVLADVVRVRGVVLESFNKVLRTDILLIVLLVLIFTLNVCVLILIF